MRSLKRKKRCTGTYVFLTVMSVIWTIPMLWILLSAFRADGSLMSTDFFPKDWSVRHFTALFTQLVPYDYPRWLLNTLYVSVMTCILSTILKVLTAYALSRARFKGRKFIMKFSLILGMFPGFMAMIAVYMLLNVLGMLDTLEALILVYSAGAGLGFFLPKGFFDTISASLDEAARIDGAGNFQVFIRIILPLSKPILVYTALISFAGPWMDFMLAKLIIQTNDRFTIPLGLMLMCSESNLSLYFGRFAAGSILIAVPIVALYACFQKYITQGMSAGSVKG